jgi:hypothetical protein
MTQDAPMRWTFGAVQGSREGGAPPTPRPGAQLTDRYQVVDELGRGAMGVVLRGHDVGADRPVAIKLLGRPWDQSRRARFLREGELTAALNHPGIVRIHGGGTTADGLPFIVMELVEGAREMGEVLEGLGPEEGARLIAEVARAVGHAHRSGVVHRDLKPENVLVDASGRARVCDFGLGWREGVEALTKTGTAVGTPMYMAPEQIRPDEGQSPGAEADVWALGVMLYHHLAGEFPFGATAYVELMVAICSARPRRPSSVRDGVPRALEQVCLRALSRDPADRYPNGDALADALADALGTGAPRRPWTAAAVAAGGVLLLAGIGALATAGGNREATAEAPAPTAGPRVGEDAPRPSAADLDRGRLEQALAKLLAGERRAAAAELQRLGPRLRQPWAQPELARARNTLASRPLRGEAVDEVVLGESLDALPLLAPHVKPEPHALIQAAVDDWAAVEDLEVREARLRRLARTGLRLRPWTSVGARLLDQLRGHYLMPTPRSGFGEVVLAAARLDVPIGSGHLSALDLEELRGDSLLHRLLRARAAMDGDDPLPAAREALALVREEDPSVGPVLRSQVWFMAVRRMRGQRPTLSHDEAEAELAAAAETDPLNPFVTAQRAKVAFRAKRDEEGLRFAREAWASYKALGWDGRIDHLRFTDTFASLSCIGEARVGELEAAEAAFRKIQVRDGEWQRAHRELQLGWPRQIRARLASGDRDGARALLEAWKESGRAEADELAQVEAELAG